MIDERKEFTDGEVILTDPSKLPRRRIRGTQLQFFEPTSDDGAWCEQFGMHAWLYPGAMPPGDWARSKRAEEATFAAIARLMEAARREWLAEMAEEEEAA